MISTALYIVGGFMLGWVCRERVAEHRARSKRPRVPVWHPTDDRGDW